MKATQATHKAPLFCKSLSCSLCSYLIHVGDNVDAQCNGVKKALNACIIVSLDTGCLSLFKQEYFQAVEETQTHIDASGLECPEPIRMAALQVKRLPAGATLSILSTDPVSPIDFRAWCARTRHEFISSEDRSNGCLITIRKRSDAV